MPRLGPLIEKFARGSRVELVPVYIVEANPARTRDDRPYGRYTLRDRTGSIQGIRWDHDVAETETGAVAYVSGNVEEYRGAPQLRVFELELVTEPSADLMERIEAPVSVELIEDLRAILIASQQTMPASFWAIFAEALGHDPLDTRGPFWTYAAAQSKHHAERGGLAWHVLTMLAEAEMVAPFYPKLDLQLLKLAVLTHDLGKLDTYRMGAAGARQLEADRTIGHTSYSMIRVHTAIEKLRAEGVAVSREDEENLLHCIAGHHGRLEWGAVREPCSAEAAALHALDYLDSQVRGQADPRSDPLPERDAPAPCEAAAPEAVDPPEEPEDDEDPFLRDDDDPFADERPSQGSLF